MRQNEKHNNYSKIHQLSSYCNGQPSFDIVNGCDKKQESAVYESTMCRLCCTDDVTLVEEPWEYVKRFVITTTQRTHTTLNSNI
eukprot:scaffold33751_cov167-Skeletonema_dohrnii-CCMP3373.AAC.1